MNKIFTCALLFVFFFIKNLNAQCPSECPKYIILNDTLGCVNTELIPDSAAYSSQVPLRSCKNSIMKYSLTTDGCYPGSAYMTYTLNSISGGTLISLSGNTFTVQWGSGNTGQVILDIHYPSAGGTAPPCRQMVRINFALTNTPVAAFSFSPNPACFNNPTTINFNSSASMNATSYYWDFGDGFTSTLPNPSHNYQTPGNYIVTLTASNTVYANGNPTCTTCVDTVKHTVVIGTLPGPDITCIATVCAGDTASYCTSAAACGTYTWLVTGGTILSGQGTSCVKVKWGTGNPQGTVNLVTTGCSVNYCTQGTTVTIPILPATGTVTGAVIACPSTTESYALPAWPATSYAWTLSGGGVISPYNTNTNVINVFWLSAGTYTLTCNYFDTSRGCGGNATYTVNVLPRMNISGPTSVCLNSNSSFNSFSPGPAPVNANWIINPGTATINSGNGTNNISVTWPVAGTYTLTATAVTAGTVCSNASYIVTVKPVPILAPIAGGDSICSGSTKVYVANSSETGNFTWNVTGSSAISLLGANNDSIQITWAATGPYQITLDQNAATTGCIAGQVSKTLFAYPSPILTGPAIVCADNVETYTVTNISSGNFNWYVTPVSFGTILSGQGTKSVTIKWHGNNNPATSNVVYLHYGVCGTDSTAITINEPPVVVITAAGTLCGPGGITLSTGVTGIFTWTGPGVPPPGNTSSITGVTVPGIYTVQIQNINGTGCNVSVSYNIPDVGKPVASISATNVINYCLPNLPNMNLVAVNAPGYTFQWYDGNGILTGQTNATLAINSLTTAGNYTFYCVVSLGGCTAVSNVITISITTCTPAPGCAATIKVTNTTGCNPFNLTLAVVSPAGATLSGTGNPTITHLEDNYIVSGLTTRNYSSIGYKQIRICATVLMPDMSICRICLDTTVLVNVAAKFTSVENCRTIKFQDASSVIAPATISGYAWSVGYNPGNTAVPPAIASFNNPATASPTLSINQTGSYIVTQTVTSGSCTVSFRDTFDLVIPNASFTVANSCVGTNILLNNIYPSPINFWNFGDAATSYTSPTSHAYGAAGPYTITHIAQIANGCRDTATQSITIVAPPVCTVTASGPVSFCFKDSVILGSSCPGLVSFQWYNNGVAIPGKNAAKDTVKQTGNYSFIAFDANGCKVVSDTIVVNVFQGPNVTITQGGSTCQGSQFTAFVPTCPGCTYQWFIDGVPAGNSSIITGVAGSGPLSIGNHIISVEVSNPLGCRDNASINITVNARPTLNINVTGPAPLCSNNLYALTGISNATLPNWVWKIYQSGPVLSTSSILSTSSAGIYQIDVTDGNTGCKRTAYQTINPSPELVLFPQGCDTICDTSKIFLPLQSLNGNLAGYTINWYDNAPAYVSVGTGVSFQLSSLPTGSHNLSVIVTSPNGCADTSNVYSVTTIDCKKVLAINGLELKVKQIGNAARLNWTTAQEKENVYFIVEKSLDALHFDFLAKVLSKGNSTNAQTYAAEDLLKDFNKTIFYRVHAVDKDGKVSYSNVVKIQPVSVLEESMVIQPNITSGLANVVINSTSNKSTMLVLYSGEGRVVMRKNVTIVTGVNTVPLDVSQLSKGFYYLSYPAQNKMITQKLVRQ